MRQRRNDKTSRISLRTSHRGQKTRAYKNILDSLIVEQNKIEYSKIKEGDKDTKERREIFSEIKRLIGYGLPEKEVVERLTEKFSTSKYQRFFQNWVNDQYKKNKTNESFQGG